MLRSRTIYASFLTLLIGTLPTIAGDGATPIWESTMISQPGKYVVTRNLAGTGPLIHITASDVDIDLNGFELAASPANPAIFGTMVSNVRIHDGTVSEGSTGIHFELSSRITIENVSVLDSAGTGIHLLDTCDYVVRRCTIFASAHSIQATAAYGCPGLIEENRIKGTGTINETVLVQGGSGSTVRDNKLTGSINGIGIHLVGCHSCEVVGNVIDDFGSDDLINGIVVEASANVAVNGNATSESIELVNSTACTLSSNRALQFRLDADSHSNLVLRNSLGSFGGGTGVHVEGDRNRIEGNLLNDKPGFGLYFTSTAQNNVYAGNLAKGNGGSGCTGTGTTEFCDEGTGNTSHGDNYMPTKM